jgi:hypothetical protein
LGLGVRVGVGVGVRGRVSLDERSCTKQFARHQSVAVCCCVVAAAAATACRCCRRQLDREREPNIVVAEAVVGIAIET